MKNRVTNTLMVVLVSVSCRQAQAQFAASGEMMVRSEYRHGYGNMIHKDSLPGMFIGSRCRIQFSHASRAVNLHASIQDVRTFGSVPIKVSEPFLSVYEAWMRIRLDSNLHLKIGRQELNYDNSRFLGSVDWAFNGRTHDFVRLKYEKEQIKLDAGGGFNQDGEKLSGAIYSTSNYKTAQLLRAEYTSSGFQIAALGWNEGRQYITLDSAGKLQKQGMRFLQTIGIPTLKASIGSVQFRAFYYHQLGFTSQGKKTDAYDAGIDLTHIIKLSPEKQSQLLYGVSAEILSGTNQSNKSENRSFSPLYGTNHAHNGYMDLFYVGGRHEKSVGLIDLSFKLKHDLNKNFFCLLNAHYFQAQTDVYNKDAKLNPYLGTETDFTAGMILAANLSVQAGYSQFFNSATLNSLRGMTFVSNAQNWAYLMVLYRPNGKKPFCGIVY